jgi:hypothetical protein
MIHDQSYSACIMNRDFLLFYKHIHHEIDKEYASGMDIVNLYIRTMGIKQKEIDKILFQNFRIFEFSTRIPTYSSMMIEIS